MSETRQPFKSGLLSALGALLLTGGSFAQFSQTPVPAFAQSAPKRSAGSDASVTTTDSFAVVQPTLLAYYQQHGGSRTFGKAISHDFQLLGRRTQVFENQVLAQGTDGSLQVVDVLTALPLIHAAGSTFPAVDPAVDANNPSLDSATYRADALAAINAGQLDSAAPDDWNGLPVAFGSTFRATITCADLPNTPVCDDTTVLSAALDVWGLPVSSPTPDPGNPDLVYLRFQRGIMQFSQSTGQTQPVPVGTWFKRVLIGTDVPDDLLQDVTGSPYYAQYAPTLPLGVARPTDLPATSLSTAFSPSSTFVTAGFAGAGDPSGTPVLAPALPTFGVTAAATPIDSAGGTNSFGSASNLSPTSTGTPGTPGVLTNSPFGTPTIATTLAPAVATPSTPIGPDPCAGDEQILFAPNKPYVGTDVLVAVTSATHHDVRTVRLTGPVKTGQVNERAGLNGWVWEWTISPTVDGWYDFTFYADGARACATSGFNTLPAFGATPVPSASATPQPFATSTPIASQTATPTSTTVPAPAFAQTGAADPASGACAGRLLRLNGSNFGQTQAALNGNVLFAAPTGTSVATILSWTNTTILVSVPSGQTAGSEQIVVTTGAGASNPLPYQIGAC